LGFELIPNSQFGMVFLCIVETLQMQTISNNARGIDTSPNVVPTQYPGVPDPVSQIRRLKISEFKSWTVCFGIISFLTGMLMYLKIGVTMETVTASLFFLSLTGMIFYIYKLILLTRVPARLESNPRHELN
jgi:hypothetical protein